MSLRFVTAGESHGPALTAILEGLPAGLALDVELINRDLARRQQGVGTGPRMKIETDRANIMGGLMDGQTTGGPLSLQVVNADHNKWKGKQVETMTAPRPGHADLTGALKYGYHDLRPSLERASARETTMRVAVGAVCKHFLSQFGIRVGGYVRAIGEITAEFGNLPYEKRFALAEGSDVRCPDENYANQMRARIQEIIQGKDTLGGILEVVAIGVPAGLGSFSQWDRRLESRLAAALMSVQAMKGVEVGPAFENAGMPGTHVQDGISLGSKGSLVRMGNRAGGIEGGISNGEPIVLRVAMKPIATTLTPQKTVDLHTGAGAPTQYERSDFCPVPRAVPILEGMVAFVLADELIAKLGGDSLIEMKPRFDQLRKMRVQDFDLDGKAHLFWP
ncbi:MAG: chorismate synthase [Anaerolineales bacterium]|nr:chorismate synthase [Anaerolineales bacterium]